MLVRLRAGPLRSPPGWARLRGAGKLIAPSRRPLSAVTAPVAGSKESSLHCSIRSANSVSMAARSIAAAERMRAPDAAPATSATASHSVRARGRAGSSRKPRPPTDCQFSPEESRRRERRSGKARAMAVGRPPALRFASGPAFAGPPPISLPSAARPPPLAIRRSSTFGTAPRGRDRSRQARAR